MKVCFSCKKIYCLYNASCCIPVWGSGQGSWHDARSQGIPEVPGTSCLNVCNSKSTYWILVVANMLLKVTRYIHITTSVGDGGGGSGVSDGVLVRWGGGRGWWGEGWGGLLLNSSCVARLFTLLHCIVKMRTKTSWFMDLGMDTIKGMPSCSANRRLAASSDVPRVVCKSSLGVSMFCPYGVFKENLLNRIW